MSDGHLFFPNNGNQLLDCLVSAKSLYCNLKKLLGYKIEQKCSSHSTSWQELPDEILEKIVQHLRLSDRIRSSIVCKSWMSVVMSSHAHEFPWLVLPQPPDCRNGKTLSFFNLSDGKVVDLKLPKKVQGGWFCGSSKGWLILIKEQGLNSQIFLLNPISGALHQLPALATIPSFQKYVETEDWQLHGAAFFAHRIVLSTSNINSDQCVVAAIFDSGDSGEELVLCKPGDKTWSVFCPLNQEHEEHLVELLFSRGKLYTLIFNKIKKEIVTRTLRFGDHALELTMVYVATIEWGDVEVEQYNDHIILTQSLSTSFLLESTNNEVLLIQKFSDYLKKINNDADENLQGEDDGNDLLEEEEEENNYDEDDVNDANADDANDEDEEEDEYDIENDETMYERTSTFKVYQIDSKTETNNFLRLQSLGEQMVFLAHHGSVSISATDLEEIEKNCIYFAGKGTATKLLPKPHRSREIGVFYLDTGKIKRSFPSINFSTRSRTSWYIPSYL